MFGIRGWVKVFSYTDPKENILDYGTWQLGKGGAWQSRRVLEGRVHGKGLVVHIEGCDDPEAARALVGSEVTIDRAELPEPEEGRFYWTDLDGLKVVTRDGVELGRVSGLRETGANDVLVVDGQRQRLVPFTFGHAVLAVDLEAGVITVDWDPDF